MELSKNIKEWINIDNEIQELNKKLKINRELKNNILKNIIDYKISNNINNTIIKFNNEHLKFTNNKQYIPLSYSLINECLKDIINDEEQVSMIIDYIKKKRNYKVVQDIKRIYL